MFRAFLQKREQEKKRKEHERLSDAEFIELLRRSPSGFKPDDLIARLGLTGAQQLLNAEWDQAKTRTALPGWRQLLKRLAVTAILVIGIKESAQFNAGIVVVKVAVVLFVIGLGIKYVNTSNWGSDWSTFAPFG